MLKYGMFKFKEHVPKVPKGSPNNHFCGVRLTNKKISISKEFFKLINYARYVKIFYDEDRNVLLLKKVDIDSKESFTVTRYSKDYGVFSCVGLSDSVPAGRYFHISNWEDGYLLEHESKAFAVPGNLSPDFVASGKEKE